MLHAGEAKRLKEIIRKKENKKKIQVEKMQAKKMRASKKDICWDGARVTTKPHHRLYSDK